MKGFGSGRAVAAACTMVVVAGAAGAGAAGAAAKAGARAKTTAPSKATPVARRGPAGSAFYRPRHLPRGRHGTLIWQRPFHGVAALKRARNTLVMYTQVGVRGKPVAVSGIVSVPKGTAPKGGWPVITYAHGTTGIAPQCAPSRDTGPGSGAHAADVGTAPLLDRWLRAGYAVVRTDYEGLGGPGVHPYLIGRSEGHGVLDIVRAARQLDPRIGARVLISGHSQGGQAALWAASLAPSYTPDLHVHGTVAFAPQSHTAQEVGLLKTIDSPALTPLGAMILRGADVADPALHVRSLLTARGAALYPQTLSACLNKLSSPSSLGGLPLDQLVSPSANLAAATRVIANNDPDRLKIKSPVLLEQGLSDTTVFPAFDQQLSTELRQRGATVTYRTYKGATHATVLNAAAGNATAFVKRRLRTR